MSRKLLRFAGRALALVWAAFWSYFAVASEYSEADALTTKMFVWAVGLFFLAGSALVSLRWERMGAVLLSLLGGILVVANFAYPNNPPANQIFLLFALALPPLLSGILLLSARPLPRTG